MASRHDACSRVAREAPPHDCGWENGWRALSLDLPFGDPDAQSARERKSEECAQVEEGVAVELLAAGESMRAKKPGVGEGVNVGVGEGVWVGVAVGVKVAVGVAVGEGVCVGVAEGMTLGGSQG